MNNILIVLPILIPLTTAILTLLLWNYRFWQRILNMVGAGFHLVATSSLLMLVRQNGIQAVQIGNWSAPFGITLVADLFSAIMLVLTGIILFFAILRYRCYNGNIPTGWST